MPPARGPRRGRASPLLMLLIALAVVAVVSVSLQKVRASMRLSACVWAFQPGCG